MKKICFLLLMGAIAARVSAQLPPVFAQKTGVKTAHDERVREYLAPVRVIWKSGDVTNDSLLLRPGNGQAVITPDPLCALKNTGEKPASILLDFGREIHGGVQLVTGMHGGGKPVQVRIRFGESVAEAMADTGGKKNATNDHAIRDQVVSLPWLGQQETGESGFRFVRIDLMPGYKEVLLKDVRAVFTYRNLEYKGSFHCSDTLLNRIWMTGAYTVQLNMQDYLWDGIKRDRLVWLGDMHPETSTIAAVFGNQNVVTKSLDLGRTTTPLPGYMNGMISYSLWWIIIQRDWYMQTGDLAYLRKQQPYLGQLLKQYIAQVGASGSEELKGGGRFLDWPTSEDKAVIHAGLQGLLLMAMQAGAELSLATGDAHTQAQCLSAVKILRKHTPDAGSSKQAAAMLSLSGLQPPAQMNKVISRNGVQDFSTFFGYYMLEAMAKGENYAGAINAIRTYWGGMLDLGATTFWEDFNIDWKKDASRIDELVSPEKKDIHGENGAYCYVGYRHSLCHGWASGPTAWLSRHVLGVEVLEAGCRKVKIVPHLGDLQFAEGTYPTPFGSIKIRHEKNAQGKVISTINAPKEITIIRG
ncbi:MAG: alpha-L-rhamnosidase [Mucilaginibacter polytrichastri]|nr:alpha-L-rhamnosidase [Mucilaginibacter polytrichastri]